MNQCLRHVYKKERKNCQHANKIERGALNGQKMPFCSTTLLVRKEALQGWSQERDVGQLFFLDFFPDVLNVTARSKFGDYCFTIYLLCI